MSEAYTNSVPDPVGKHTFAFYTKCVTPVGHFVVLAPETIDEVCV